MKLSSFIHIGQGTCIVYTIDSNNITHGFVSFGSETITQEDIPALVEENGPCPRIHGPWLDFSCSLPLSDQKLF